MNRIELATAISTAHGLTKKEGEAVVATFFETITKSLKKGEPVSVIGFGTLKTVAKAARNGRNPRTGEAVKGYAGTSVKFVAGTALKHAVDPKLAKRDAAKALAAGGAAPVKAAAKKAPAKKAAK